MTFCIFRILIAWFPLTSREVRKVLALAPPSAPAWKRYVETTTMAQPRALPKVEANPTFLAYAPRWPAHYYAIANRNMNHAITSARD